MECRNEQMLVPRLGLEKVRHWVMEIDWWKKLLMVLRLDSHLVLKWALKMGCRKE